DPTAARPAPPGHRLRERPGRPCVRPVLRQRHDRCGRRRTRPPLRRHREEPGVCRTVPAPAARGDAGSRGTAEGLTMTEHQPPPNYVPRIQALVARQVIRVGESFEVDIRHEPACPVLLVWTRPALPEPEPQPAPEGPLVAPSPLVAAVARGVADRAGPVLDARPGGRVAVDDPARPGRRPVHPPAPPAA